MDREPIETEDKLAVRVLHHDWGSGSKRPSRPIAFVIGLALILAAAVALFYINRSSSDVHPLAETLEQPVRRIVESIVSEEPFVIDEPHESRIVHDTLDVPDLSVFEILERKNIWDLRNWKKVSNDNVGVEGSVSVMHWVLTARKVAETDTFIIAPKTFGRNLYCRSLSPQYAYEVHAVRDYRLTGSTAMLESRIHIDVSDVDVGAEFVVRGVNSYWNIHQSSSNRWVGVVGRDGMERTSQLVIFPQGKGWMDYRLTKAINFGEIQTEPMPFQGDNSVLLTGKDDFHWIYWEIFNPEPGYVFQLGWDW